MTRRTHSAGSQPPRRRFAAAFRASTALATVSRSMPEMRQHAHGGSRSGRTPSPVRRFVLINRGSSLGTCRQRRCVERGWSKMRHARRSVTQSRPRVSRRAKKRCQEPFLHRLGRNRPPSLARIGLNALLVVAVSVENCGKPRIRRIVVTTIRRSYLPCFDRSRAE